MKANIKYSNSDDLSIIITSFKLSPVNNIKHLWSYTYKYFVLHIVISNLLSHYHYQIGTESLQRWWNPRDSFPSSSSSFRFGILSSSSRSNPGWPSCPSCRSSCTKCRACLHEEFRFFGLDASERLVLHLLGGTVGAGAFARLERCCQFPRIFVFCRFQLFVFVDIAVAAVGIRRLGNFLSTVGLQLFRGRRLRSRFAEISLLFVL